MKELIEELQHKIETTKNFPSINPCSEDSVALTLILENQIVLMQAISYLLQELGKPFAIIDIPKDDFGGFFSSDFSGFFSRQKNILKTKAKYIGYHAYCRGCQVNYFSLDTILYCHICSSSRLMQYHKNSEKCLMYCSETEWLSE